MEIVNPVPGDELVRWTVPLLTTFLRAPDAEAERRAGERWAERLLPERTWGARDDGRWVATLATDARTITVPGPGRGTRELPVDALTAVTVAATHRRRGLLTTMLDAALAQASDRGDALSYLVAAEWPIYGRFGYGAATRQANYLYHSRSPGAAIAPGPGHVRHVEPAQFAELGPAVFDRARRYRAGDIDRAPRYWRSQLEEHPQDGRVNIVVHDGPDGPDGWVCWKPTRDFELGDGLGAVQVTDLVAASPEAYRNLWAYLSGIDVVDEVVLRGRPVDEPARWLMADGRALQCTFQGDFTWVRLLDVPAALTARSYRASGRVVFEVVDTATGGYAAGRYLLDATPDGATCTRTTASPDITLPATTLGGAYLGDHPLATALLTGDVEEHVAGAVDRADLILGTTVPPFCRTGF